MSQIYKFIIKVSEHGQRLDKFLTQKIEGASRSLIKKWIDKVAVKINEGVSKCGHILHKGDSVVLDQPPTEPLDVLPEDIPLKILYEDGEIIVVDKPVGMVVHPAPGNRHGTLVNALLYHCRDLATTDNPFRPGLVHRLDKGTSGVMIVAKNEQALRHLSKQFRKRRIKKVYHAIVYGEVPRDEGMIESSIGRDRVHRQKMSSRTQKGREAHTLYRVLKRGEGLSYVRIEIKTGRTHQIRVHFSEMGYPLVGDDIYGGKNKWTQIKSQVLASLLATLDHPLLQAVELGFIHPKLNENMLFNSKLDSKFNEILSYMKGAE